MGNNWSPYKIIRVRPTLTEDSAYTAGDVVFNTTEIPNAVIGDGGCSELIGAYLLDEQMVTSDLEIYFMETSTAFATSAMHNTADITDANLEAAKIIGAAKVDGSDAATTGIDNAIIHRLLLSNQSGGGEGNTSMLLQAAAGSTSVYFTGTCNSTPTYADTDSLEFIFHIKYR